MSEIDPGVRQSCIQLRDKLDQGLSLSEAYSSLQRLLEGIGASVEQLQKIEEARKILEDQIGELEYLNRPGIRAANLQSRYIGPLEGDTFWERYQTYLLEEKHWGEEAVTSINLSSNQVLWGFPPPTVQDFSTRGLVVGYVQSGKTANLTAVLAKAADWGYKYFIVLAGLTNALRKQTQERLEEDLQVERFPRDWYLWTNAESDFEIPGGGRFPRFHDEQKHLAIIKKNSAPLSKILATFKQSPTAEIARLPVLVIDDEADQASVNTTGSIYDMTAINGEIRNLLKFLKKTTYVGYTATPFANVLIDPEFVVDPVHPDDLYPKDFIVSLPAPEGYFGAERLFGRYPVDADEFPPDSEGLDMINLVEDPETASLQPPSAKDRETFQPEMTDSLRDAIYYFVMATAARHFRGDKDSHSSMLVHTTVNTAPHFKIAALVEKCIQNLSEQFKAGDASLLAELENLWDREQEKVDSKGFGLEPVSFDSLRKHFEEVVNSIQVPIENSVSDERIDYQTGPKKYIVVGGSVLARGLTLEGLIVSYFIRTSSQYDSLMQMGRWFGYRKGYEDLPRVWMTKSLSEAFRDLATVEAEIREDISVYSERGITPLEFAVRIRQIPGMAITARNKMYAAESCDISYSNEHIQTTRFCHKDLGWLKNNWGAGAHLVDHQLAKGSVFKPTKKGRLLEGVPVADIFKFLNEYSVHKKQSDMDTDLLSKYIHQGMERGQVGLEMWNLGIVEPSGASQSDLALGNLGKVGTVIRSQMKPVADDDDAYIKALMSRKDVLFDVPELEYSGTDNWEAIKVFRQANLDHLRPLLLLYAINKTSAPARKGNREPLEALMDVLGIAIVFPNEGDGVPKNRVHVRLQKPDHEELLELDNEESDENGK